MVAPSQNSSLPFDPTKVLGYPVNATDAGSIYDSITRNAKVQCGKSPLPIRCGIVKTVQDVETFRNQPVPPPAALLDQIHKFMNQDFEEAEKIIKEKMSKDLQDHESNHEGRVKNVTARIQEAQNVLQQIKDEALNLVVDQKKRVASLQKDIDDQKYFLEELNKILKKPPTPAANPIPLTQIVSQPTAIPTSSGTTAPIYAATVVKQAESQLGRVQSESLNEDTADPVALTSAPVVQRVTAVPTSAPSVQYQTTQAPVLLNTAPTQTTVTQAGAQVSVQVIKSQDNKVQEPPKSTTATSSTNQTASKQEPAKDTSSSPNIFVRFWRWLTGRSSSSSTTNNGSGISGHVVLNKRPDN